MPVSPSIVIRKLRRKESSHICFIGGEDATSAEDGGTKCEGISFSVLKFELCVELVCCKSFESSSYMVEAKGKIIFEVRGGLTFKFSGFETEASSMEEAATDEIEDVGNASE